MIRVKVRFLGIFQEFCGKSQVTIELEDMVTVSNFIQKLAERFSSKCREALIDPGLSDPRPNALILVNGKEIGVLQGLQTLLCNGDEMVLLPVVHGG